MDRHNDVFFSDEDVARFAKGRIFLGEPLSDASKLKLALGVSSFATHDVESSDFAIATRILPTASQCQRIREQTERNELHISKMDDEYCVTADSLPFVYDDSSTHDHMDRRTDAESRELCANDNTTTLRDTNDSLKYPPKGSINNANEGGRDELISTPDEDEESSRKGMVRDTSKRRKISHTEKIEQIIALDKSKDGRWLNKKSDLHAQKNGVATHESFTNNKKNSYDLHSDHSDDDRWDSSDGEISDELISDDGSDLEGNADNNLILKTSNAKLSSTTAAAKSQNNSLITSSEAIGSSIIKSIPTDSGWHSRRSESEVVLSRLKRKSLLKRQRRSKSPEGQRAGGGSVQRRTTLRFAAAPVAVNKRKKQMTLTSMFKK